MQVDVGGDGDVGQRIVVRAVALAQHREAEIGLERLPGRLQHRHAVQAGHLRRRVHHRGPGGVLHRLADEDRTDMPPQLLDLPVIGCLGVDHRQVELRGQGQPLIVAEPGLEREVALGREVRRYPVQRHHLGQRLRDVRDVGDDSTLGRAYRVVGCEHPVDAEHLHEPAFLGGRVVAGAGHGPGMADGPGQLGLPAPDHAGDDRLLRLQPQLVVAAGLGIHHRGLAAVVVAQRVDELRGGEVDVDVLAAGDRGGGAPAGRRQIVGDGGGEVAGVGEDRHRALEQGLARIVAAQRPADPDPVPGIRHAQPVGTEDVDAVLLAHGADLARIVDRDLLADDDDLLEIRIDPGQLGHPVAHRRGWQVDHAGVEAVAGIEALAHRVVHRHVAERRLQLLAAAPGRGPEHDVAAGEGVADRGHVAGFATQDVQHADPVVARRDLGQIVDADIVFEAGNALLVHRCCPDLGWWVQAALRMPRRCASCSRPPAFIQRSAAWA